MLKPLKLALLIAATALSPAAASAHEGAQGMSPAFLAAMKPMIPRDAATARVVTTRHAITIDGRRVAYRAIVREDPLAGPNGKPAAVAVTYAYVAEGLGDPAKRPVLFLFNGGPGASSSPLHMKAFGPRRIVGEGAEARIEDNPYSLLDAADLVFVDPIGTGASMPIKGADASGFFGVGGDARSVARIIADWQKANGRESSPTILVGESYGTARALAILHEDAKAKRKTPDGIVLLSLAIGGADLPLIQNVLNLPSFSAVAWYHHAIDRGGRTVAQQFDLARDFADTDYVSALVRGSSLPAAERHRIAERVSQLIGIPAATIEKDGLAIDKHDFMLALLADKGLRTGQLDARITRAIAQSNFHPPFDDPSMSLGAGSTSPIATYLTKELGYTLPSPYRSLNLGINFKWKWDEDYGGSYRDATFAPFLADAMKADPKLLVFTGGGYYDLTTPAAEGTFALDQAGVPVDRRMVRYYPTGHSIGEDDKGLAALSRDLKSFIRMVEKE